jgi:hypothetical protein
MDANQTDLLTRADAAIRDAEHLREQVRESLVQAREHLSTIATTIQNGQTGLYRSWQNWRLSD